jgi:hypothetical protein
MTENATSTDEADELPATYDEWIDALDAGEGFYLESPAGYGSLPPRRVCPHTGSTDLTQEPLPETGTVETYSVVHVGATEFADDTPYISAVASFGPVQLTGVLRGVDPEAVDIGDKVSVTVETRDTTDDRLVVFRPA